MKKKINSTLLILFFLLMCRDSAAQNLVPNPSFEEYANCPVTNLDSTIKYLNYWKPLHTYSIFLNSPDFYNTCVPFDYTNSSIPVNSFGMQTAKSGNGYIGLFAYSRGPIPFFEDTLPIGREYLGTKLLNKLKVNHKYYVEFYVSLADESSYAISTMGIFFSDTALVATRNYVNKDCQVQNKLISNLTDKESWVMIADSFLAQGGEEYLYLGNFVHDSLSDTTKLNSFGGQAYYYIDDVLVVDVDSLEFLTTDVKTPKEETFTSRLKAFPNPTSAELYIYCQLQSNEKLSVGIYDVQGRLIAEKVGLDSYMLFDLSALSPGIYVCKTTTSLGFNKTERVIINR